MLAEHPKGFLRLCPFGEYVSDQGELMLPSLSNKVVAALIVSRLLAPFRNFKDLTVVDRHGAVALLWVFRSLSKAWRQLMDSTIE